MWRSLILACAIACIGSAQAFSQSRLGTVAVVDSDVLFSQSAFGKRVSAELAVQSRDLSAENRQIEKELEQEEKDLTMQRAELEADAFRVLADQFDAKVQLIRAQQLSKTRALNAKIESDRVIFLQSATPILEGLMRELGASVLIERRNTVLSADDADLTQDAITRIDSVLGDGSQPETSGE